MARRIGRYEILEELGRGAMGSVYRARDPQLDRVVAIKVIRTTDLSAAEVEEYKQRFFREARTAGQMAHPGIVTIHDILEDEAGHPCLVMEFIEGTTLEDILAPAGTSRSGPLPLEKALDLGHQVADALNYAHRRGVVHRDIKPANILVTREGRAKIADFGIAKLAGTQMTTTGQVVGTPAFMSPEQFSGGTIDGRSDIFSLGAMLYWMFTGNKPFPGDSLSTVSFQIVYKEPPAPRSANPGLPPQVEAVVLKALAKKPEERYATAGALAADLAAIRAGKPVSVTPKPRPAPHPDDTTAVGFPVPPPPAAAPEKSAAERMAVRPMSKAVAPKTVTRPRGGPVPTLYLGLGGGALLLLLVLMLVWPRGADGPPPPAAPEPEQAAPAAAAPAGGPGTESPRAPAPRPAAGQAAAPSETGARQIPTAVQLELEHDFRTAKLEVYADGKFLTETALRGQVSKREGKPAVHGTLSTRLEFPAGTTALNVVVASPLYSYEQSSTIALRPGVRILRAVASGSTGFHSLTLTWE